MRVAISGTPPTRGLRSYRFSITPTESFTRVNEEEGIVEVPRFWHSHRDEPFREPLICHEPSSRATHHSLLTLMKKHLISLFAALLILPSSFAARPNVV